jgi:hypothetical protein
MRKRNDQVSSEIGQTQPLPPSPLFPPEGSPDTTTRADVPTTRAVWKIVLTVVFGTLLVVALAGGAFAAYHDKTNEVSQLKRERTNLRATNAALTTQLTTAHAKLVRANAKLTRTTSGLLRAKRNLTKMHGDLVAANEWADANYSSGYSAGNSEGYSSGVSAGLVQGSDQLTCSDDPDVYWLPAC